MSNGRQEELLARLTNITHDIRFAKEQQWRTVYYSLILFSAFIAIALRYGPIDPTLKLFIYIIVWIVAAIAIYYQLSINKRIIVYRDHSSIINEMLNSGIFDEIKNQSDYPNPEPKIHNMELLLYTIPFILLILLGTVIVSIILYCDIT